MGSEAEFTEPIIHVDMDAFFVEVERRRRPQLQGRPVVVGGGGNRGVVASASYEARAFGIRSAMPMAHARRACPDLTVVAPDHAEYQRTSEQVFAVFRSFTPLVEGLSLDEAFLDVSGLRRTVTSPIEVGEAIRLQLRSDLGLPASVGIAATKFVAKLASEAAKPDGLRHVPAAATLRFIQPLPVRSLWGVGEATYALLEELGVETVGDLASLQPRVLERRLGRSLSSHLQALAIGDDPRPVEPELGAKSVSVSETYQQDLTSSAEVETEFLRLCDRLAYRLRRSGLAGRTISIRVRYSDFTTISRSETLRHHTDSAHQLREATARLSDRVDWSRPVRLLGLEVSHLTGADEPRQLMAGDHGKWEELAGAVDRIRDRFGSGSIRPARLGEAPSLRLPTSSDSFTDSYTEGAGGRPGPVSQKPGRASTDH
jgi:DNA polymerase-4